MSDNDHRLVRDWSSAPDTDEAVLLYGGNQAQIAKKYRVFARFDDLTQLVAKSPQLRWAGINDEHAVLDSITVGLQLV